MEEVFGGGYDDRPRTPQTGAGRPQLRPFFGSLKS